MDQSSLAGKWIGLLRDAVPQIERVALVWDPNSAPDQLEAAKAAASTLRIDALVLEVRRHDDFDGAFKSLGNERRTGVVLLSSPTFVSPRARFGDAALKYRLPTTSPIQKYRHPTQCPQRQVSHRLHAGFDVPSPAARMHSDT